MKGKLAAAIFPFLMHNSQFTIYFFGRDLENYFEKSDYFVKFVVALEIYFRIQHIRDLKSNEKRNGRQQCPDIQPGG